MANLGEEGTSVIFVGFGGGGAGESEGSVIVLWS